MKNRVKIYIPEVIPTLNKGEEAIIRGILQGFKEEGIDVDVTVYSGVPQIDQQRLPDLKVIGGMTFRPGNMGKVRKSIELARIWLYHFLFAFTYKVLGARSLKLFKGDVWRAYCESDLILVGHDGVFSDINLLFAVFVRLLGKKHVIFGMGFSGFRSVMGRKFARFLMPLFNLVVLREQGTFDHLVSMGVRADMMHVKPDPAFFLQPSGDVELKTLLEEEGLNAVEGPLIGMIAVRGSKIFNNCFSHIKDLQAKHAEHVKLFACIAEYVIETTGGTILFLPHCIGSEPDRDDRRVARDIKAAVQEKYRDKIINIENEYSGPLLKKLIQRLDFLVAERTHALIGACSVGTPFIAVTVTQDTRTHDIIGKTCGMKELIVDINQPDLPAILTLFDEKWQSRNEIRKILIERAVHVHQECRSAAKLLADVVRAR